MSIAVKLPEVPPGTHLDVTVRLSADINITPFAARQKVNRLLMSEVGDRVGAETPELVAGNTLRWRLPVYVYSPTRGPLGQAGCIDVDVDTGEILTSDEALAEIARHASLLAAGSPP